MSGDGRFRVAMVAPPFLPVPPRRYGGTELVIAELIDGLAACGVEVTLFAAPGSRGGYTRGCEVVNVLPRAVWPPIESAELRHCAGAFEQIRGGDFDLVHAHCPLAVEAAGELSVPLLVTVHHDRTAKHSEIYARHPGVHYAFISRRQRELEVPVPSAVVHHGIDPARFRFGRGQGGHAAFLGRFSACKGLHHAIDAASMAGVRLRIAGRPHAPDHAYFSAEVAPRLARTREVQRIGEVDHPGKVALLGASMAMLFPIEWEEPFGLVMVEAMLCGTPVIAFPRGAAPEVINPGVTGFLVDSAAEMSRVLRGLARGTFDRRACRARAAGRFGRQAMVARYLALYAELLAQEAPAASSLASAESLG